MTSITFSPISTIETWYLLFLLLGLLDDLALAIVLKGVHGNLVQAQHWLVGVLDEHVLALLTLQAHVGDRADNTPSVGERQVHLLCKVARLPAYDAENDVAIVRLGVGTRDESRYRLVNFQQDTEVNTYPSFMTSARAMILWTVHRASLHELFFISVATTAPR